MTEWQNFSGQVTPAIVDTEYRHCNFTQLVPVDDGGLKRGVRLFPGDDTPRTFINCNMCNCEPPPGSALTKCNGVIKEFGVETTSDTITIDGESVVMQHHSDFIYGCRTATGYDDWPSPIEVEVD